MRTPNFKAVASRVEYWKFSTGQTQAAWLSGKCQAAGTTLVIDETESGLIEAGRRRRERQFFRPTRRHHFLLEEEHVIAGYGFGTPDCLELPPLFERKLLAKIEIHGSEFALQLAACCQHLVDLRVDLALIGLISVEQGL